MQSSLAEILSGLARTKLSDIVKVSVIGLGALVLSLAAMHFPASAYTWGYASLLAFGVFISPRMTLTLPRSKFAVSFSDALIFIAFLLYGGESAILLATAETAANCYYLKRSGFHWGRRMIAANVSINILATGATYLVWIALPHLAGYSFSHDKTQHLISLLGVLAFTQFAVSSSLAAVFHALKDNAPLWSTWKNHCFASSMTQIAGAGLAAIVVKVVNYGDVVTAMIAFVAMAVAFLNYRRSIAEINDAFGQVQRAEREKAETERERRREAERHASQLAVTLEKEERANEALRKSESDLQHAALHDSLTGLANRKKLGDVLRSLIERSKADPTAHFQVLFLDIRRFKDINDSLGHSIGDRVLSIAAKRFRRILQAGDTVARIGGDEFAIVLNDISSASKAKKVAYRIQKNLTQPFSLSGNRITIELNIGIAPSDAEYDTPEEILRDADIAMHFAKERDGEPAIFSREMRSRFLERVRYENDLRHAVERRELLLHYQPIIGLADGKLIGFEALLRWQHSEFGLIPPNKFIPIAEQSGLIQPITVWILNETCRQLQEWRAISAEYSDLLVSVNISGKHLSNEDLLHDVEAALRSTGLPADALKLEITESTAMENAEHTINMLLKLKQIGVKLSIDDFGTGYSSLSYLHRLPFDTLKIDRSFVNRVGENGEQSEILQTIISLAKNLKMRVIAEGIETAPQLAVLRNLGCDYGQGYLMARPKGKEETENLLYSRPAWLPEAPEHFSNGHKAPRQPHSPGPRAS
jgi:diguanylate cyclase (GGDEF)-like protein